MTRTPAQRMIVFGTSLAAALVVTILVFTGGRKPTPAPVPAPAGEAALPMLDGVNKNEEAPHIHPTLNETTAKAESKPASGSPLNH